MLLRVLIVLLVLILLHIHDERSCPTLCDTGGYVVLLWLVCPSAYDATGMVFAIRRRGRVTSKHKLAYFLCLVGIVIVFEQQVAQVFGKTERVWRIQTTPGTAETMVLLLLRRLRPG